GSSSPVAFSQAAAAELAGSADARVAADRSVISAGGGVVRSAAGPVARELGDAIGAVFMHSLTASNVAGSPHSLGITGAFTPEYRLAAVRAADLVLMLGATSNSFRTRKVHLVGTVNLHRTA